jgi:hypothetical protein
MSSVEYGVAHVDGASWGRIYGSPPEPVRFERKLLPKFQHLDDVAFVRDPDDPAFAIKVSYASVVDHYVQRASAVGGIDAEAAGPLRYFVLSRLASLSDDKRDRDLDRLRRALDRVAKLARAGGGTVTLANLAAADLREV